MSHRPKQSQIKAGAILGSLAHAIAVNRLPEISHEQSWDHSNYCVQNSAGSRGTIAFHDNCLVGAFFLEESARNPFRNPEATFDNARYLLGLPSALEPLAHNEALQYLLQESVRGVAPVITSAFWGDGADELVSTAEPWEDAFSHGASLIEIQLLPFDDALMRWVAEFNLLSEEAALVTKMFDQKMIGSGERITLNEASKKMIRTTSCGEEGFEACCESLGEIGISLAN